MAGDFYCWNGYTSSPAGGHKVSSNRWLPLDCTAASLGQPLNNSEEQVAAMRSAEAALPRSIAKQRAG